ncbi:response regulator [Niabella pedocola]|uniref:Response regulator n=1 Tax=Niabella pedocola TaxID=1752077 RepID=A0ABS8PMY5_9BACT|nr:response regulator [Niabella pedocola]MCD2422104.1 response regulator [Niabella pedocola]
MEKQILLIEDDSDICDLLEYILSADSYDLTVCTTIAEGKKEIDRTIPDLIILDIMLPDGNGSDLCNQIKSTLGTNKIKIILMSALEQPPNSHADHFIAKPFNIHTLKSTVSACLYSLGLLLFQMARL